MLDAAFDMVDAREALPSDETPCDEAFGSFVTALCQCVSMDAVENATLVADYFTADKVNRLLTHTLLRLLCIGQSDHDILEGDPSEYHRRTEEETSAIMGDYIMVACPHGNDAADGCEFCEDARYENIEKSTARSATMGMIQSLAGLDGCAEPYLVYLAEALESTSDDDADNISLRCGLFKAFAAAAQHAPQGTPTVQKLVINVLENHVLPQLSSVGHDLVVHLRCACCAIAERYLSFLVEMDRVDLVFAVLEAMINLVADPDEGVRLHAYEAFRTAIRTHAILQGLLFRHSPDLLGRVCSLLQGIAIDAPCAPDVLRLVTACMFKFLGRLGDAVDFETAVESERAAGVVDSHKVLLEMLATRFHEVAQALAAAKETGGPCTELEALLMRHIETIHAVSISSPMTKTPLQNSPSIHEDLVEILAPVGMALLTPMLVHAANKHDVIADSIDCITLLPSGDPMVQDGLIPALMEVIAENVSGRDMCVHPLCYLLHYGGLRVLGSEHGDTLVKLVEQAFTSDSPIFLCYVADLVRSIAIVSAAGGDNEDVIEFRQHFVQLVLQQLLRMVNVKPTSIPGAQYPVRLTSALCAMLYVHPASTWATVLAPMDEASSGFALLCHVGLAEGFPALSMKRNLDVLIMLLALSRTAYLEACTGAFTPELWMGCFSLLKKYHQGFATSSEGSGCDEFLYDPDDGIDETEGCELVEAEMTNALTDHPHTVLRDAVVYISESTPEVQPQLMEMAGATLWDLLMSDEDPEQGGD
jgi:hypothetical protein